MNCERAMSPAAPLHPMLGIAFINFIFVLIILVVFFSFFATPSGFEIRLSGVGPVVSERNQAVIRITGENVLYLNGRVLTFNELKKALLKINPVKTAIDVQVDRRASMGRTADVWQLCKGLGLAQVKITTIQP